MSNKSTSTLSHMYISLSHSRCFSRNQSWYSSLSTWLWCMASYIFSLKHIRSHSRKREGGIKALELYHSLASSLEFYVVPLRSRKYSIETSISCQTLTWPSPPPLRLNTTVTPYHKFELTFFQNHHQDPFRPQTQRKRQSHSRRTTTAHDPRRLPPSNRPLLVCMDIKPTHLMGTTSHLFHPHRMGNTHDFHARIELHHRRVHVACQLCNRW